MGFGARKSKEALIRARREAREKNGTHGTTLYGNRRKFVKSAEGLVAIAGDQIRAEICNPEFIKEFCETLKFGASRQVLDKTCIKAVLLITNLLGEQQNIVIQFLQNAGVAGEGQFRQMVEQSRAVEGVDEHETAESCTLFLEGYLAMNPGMREGLIRRLGGLVAVPDSVRV